MITRPPRRRGAPLELLRQLVLEEDGGFWLLFFAWVATAFVSYVFRPKTPKGQNQLPSAIGDFQIQTADKTRPEQYARGRFLQKGGNVTWYGDLAQVPIKKRVKTGLFSSTDQLVGFRYYMSQQIGLCFGRLDELIDIRFDDRIIPFGDIVITPLNAVIRLHYNYGHIGETAFDAACPVGTYHDPIEVCAALRGAIIAADPGGSFNRGNWKPLFGFHIKAGYNDEQVIRILLDDSTQHVYHVHVTPGAYQTGVVAAAAVGAAIAATIPAGELTCVASFSTSTNRFTFTPTFNGHAVGWEWDCFDQDAPTDQWYDRAIAPTIGLVTGEAYAVYPYGTETDPVVSQISVLPNRYVISCLDILDFGGFVPAVDLTAFFSLASIMGFDNAVYAPLELDDVGIHNRATAPHDKIFPGITDFGDYWEVVVDQPNFFGGDDREGGISGTLRIYKGTQTQVMDPWLVAKLGHDLPSYRGHAYCVWLHLYVGTSSYMKSFSLQLGAHPNALALTGGHERIGDDWNPACAIHEILTEPLFGVEPVPESLLDLTSFRAAGDALYAEGLGISINVDQVTTKVDLINEILRTIDATLQPDPSSGKLRLKLIREDYDAGALFELNPSNTDAVEEVRPRSDQVVNAVRVSFVNRSLSYQDDVAQEQNNASVQSSGVGAANVQSVDARMITTAANAQKIAARALNTVSSSPMTFALKSNRQARNLRVGDPVKLTWPPKGISNMICRVQSAEPGELGDGSGSSRVTLDLVENVFALWRTAFSPPPDSGWTDPSSSPPAPPTAERITEAPYAIVAGEDRRILALAVQGAGLALGYSVLSDPDIDGVLEPTNSIPGTCPSGLLVAGISKTATEILIGTSINMNGLTSATDDEFDHGRNLVLIDDEWIAWQNITDNGDGSFKLTGLARGVMDTVPADHSSAARAWFPGDGGFGYTTASPYGSDLTLAAKLLPYNSIGVVAESAVGLITETTRSRAQRPNAPTAFAVNGLSYPGAVTGDLHFHWQHRDRLGSWLYFDSGITAEIEPGTAYRLTLYANGMGYGMSYGDDWGGAIHVETGLTGLSFDYTEATETADVGFLSTQFRVVLEAYRISDGTTSYQVIDHIFGRTP